MVARITLAAPLVVGFTACAEKKVEKLARGPSVTSPAPASASPLASIPVSVVAAEAPTFEHGPSGVADSPIALDVMANSCWDAELGVDRPEIVTSGFPALSDDGRFLAAFDAVGSGDELAAQIVDLEHEVAVEWFSLGLPPALGPAVAWRCAEPHERGKRARYAAVKKHYAEISAKLNRGRKWRALDEFAIHWHPSLRLRDAGPHNRHFIADTFALEVLPSADSASNFPAMLAVRDPGDVTVGPVAGDIAVTNVAAPRKILRLDRKSPTCALRPRCEPDVEVVAYSRARGLVIISEQQSPQDECGAACGARGPLYRALRKP